MDQEDFSPRVSFVTPATLEIARKALKSVPEIEGLMSIEHRPEQGSIFDRQYQAADNVQALDIQMLLHLTAQLYAAKILAKTSRKDLQFDHLEGTLQYKLTEAIAVTITSEEHDISADHQLEKLLDNESSIAYDFLNRISNFLDQELSKNPPSPGTIKLG